jgi:hypothetical protein
MRSIKAMRLGAAVIAVVACISPGSAQSLKYAVEPRASLAWWQVDPHYGHLWATTCPDDPGWQPGEGRSPGYYIDYFRRHQILDTGRSDSRIPLYPRNRLRYVCRSAVIGHIDVEDTISWRVRNGRISILADSLVTGLDMRDSYARKYVLQTRQHPAIFFTIDSVTNRSVAADTIIGMAVGTFNLHGVQKRITAPVRAWPEGGGLRVKTQIQFPAKDLIHEWQMSKTALGMGVVMGQWKEVYMGVDLLLKRVTQTSGT